MHTIRRNVRTARQAVPLPYLGKAGGQERDRQDRLGRECGGRLHSVWVPMRTNYIQEKGHLDLKQDLMWSGASSFYSRKNREGPGMVRRFKSLSLGECVPTCVGLVMLL